MARAIQTLDPVALMEDMPEHGLCRGQVGTVVESLTDGTFEVEFADHRGQAYAMAALRDDQLMLLHHEATGT